MCCYKTLYHNEDGYVVRCNSCQHMQLAFGTTVQSFTAEQYRDYLATVDEHYEYNKFSGFRDQKTIQIPTVARSLSLVYSVNELYRLRQLLIKGRNSLEAEKLFVFNEN